MAQTLPTASANDVNFMSQHLTSITKTLSPRLAQTKQVHAAAGPVNTVAPAVTGSITVGQVETCANGTWLNSPTFTYQWRRSNNKSHFVDIPGATANTYTLVAADVGSDIRCLVTGTNGAGVTAAYSNAISP